MKPHSAAMAALLASRQFYVADLYTFSLIDGITLRYCAGDQDLVVNGISFPAGAQTGPYFDRQGNKAKYHQKTGTASDQLIFDVLPGVATVGGAPFLQACHEGLFDGCELTLDRVFMPTYGDTSCGFLRLFVGHCGAIDAGRSVATFTFNTHMDLLNLMTPRNVYQAGCLNNLGDAACTVSLSSFKTACTDAGGSTPNMIVANITNAQLGAFDQGKIIVTSGLNHGLSAPIQSCTYGSPGAVNLLTPLPIALAPGDTFDAYFGCDRSSGFQLGPTLSGNLLLTGNSHSNNIVDNISNMAGITLYAQFSASGFAPGTYVTAIGANSVTLNNSSSTTVTGLQLEFLSMNGCAKFSNQANWRGFKDIPQPVTAL